MIGKTIKNIKRVAFFGDADLPKSDWAYQEAVETAKLLAKNGYIVVNGGGPGIMEAATMGAKGGGGKVELVVVNPKKEPNNYEGINEKNKQQADKIYYTNNYQERLNKLMEIADAFVIFKGGTGTLSEVGLTWEMAKFDYGKHEPLIFVGKEWKEIVELIEKKMNYEGKEKRVVATVEKAKEVVEVLKRV